MHYLEVAVPTPLTRTFTYLAEAQVAAGSRVLVPFGRRRLVGVALGPGAPQPAGGVETVEIKTVERVIDPDPVYSPTMLDLARRLSAYYMHPLGEVLRTMLPASTTKVVKETATLTPFGLDERKGKHSPEGRLLSKIFGKKKDELASARVKAKIKKLADDGDLDAQAIKLKDLIKAGLITQSRGTDLRARSQDRSLFQELSPSFKSAASAAGEAPHGSKKDGISEEENGQKELPVLTPRQQAVIDTVLAAPAPRPYLLHGVTGSGKTEVYLRLITATLERTGGEAQALVLVPEISLTPQMTRVFESRFPGKVAVVHSAMTDADRWAQLARIRSGAAAVLIGPRSAVFGPFRRLGLILVDEEHDSSYKQSTGLAYNGRDVAVLRAMLEGVPVVLGSATPSMESYNNALTGRYGLLELPERVTGRPLPLIEVLASEPQRAQGTVVGSAAADDEIPIDARVTDALRENLAAGRQAIVLVNRRGYAYYLFSVEEKKAVQCPYCSISMTLHARSTVLRCHYCDYQTTVQRVLAAKPTGTYVAVGYGSQKAEDCLARLVPGARIVRLDSDSVAQRDVLPRTLARFRNGQIDVLVGTQILAKGHDFPNVTLIAILEVDQLLGLPDFRAGERTFQLVVQAAGRAGRAELAGRVLIQTLRPGHPVVTAAVRQDYRAFAKRELEFRQQHAYPPFARLVAVELNSPDQPVLVQLCGRIERWAEQMAALYPQLVQEVRLLGPGVPPIERVRSRHRRTLIFSSPKMEPLRAYVGHFLTAFKKLPGDVRLKVDVDPQSLI